MFDDSTLMYRAWDQGNGPGAGAAVAAAVGEAVILPSDGLAAAGLGETVVVLTTPGEGPGGIVASTKRAAGQSAAAAGEAALEGGAEARHRVLGYRVQNTGHRTQSSGQRSAIRKARAQD